MNKWVGFFLICCAFASGSCIVPGPSSESIQTAIADTEIAEIESSIATIYAQTQEVSGQGFEQITGEGTTQSPSANVEGLLTPAPIYSSRFPSLLWSTEVESYVVTQKTVFAELVDGSVQALDITTGMATWISEINGEVIGVDEANVYISPAEKRIDAIDRRDGKWKWRSLLSLPLDPQRLIQIIPDKLLVPIQHSGVHLIDQETGEILRTIVNPDFVWFNEELEISLLQDGVVIWDWAKVTTFAIDGKPLLNWPCSGMLLLEGIGEVGELRIESFDLLTGNHLWSTEIGNYDEIVCPVQIDIGEDVIHPKMLVYSSLFKILYPYIDSDSNNIYLAASGRGGMDRAQKLIAINTSDGHIRWVGNLSSTGFRSSNENFNWLGEIRGNLVYSHVMYGLTQAFDTLTHGLNWENPTIVLEEIIGSTEDVLVARIWETPSSVFDDPPNIVVGLDINTGEEKWRLDLGTYEDAWTIPGYFIYRQARPRGLVFVDISTGLDISFVEHDSEKWDEPVILPFGDLILAISLNRISVISP